MPFFVEDLGKYFPHCLKRQVYRSKHLYVSPSTGREMQIVRDGFADAVTKLS
ncbi:MAG: hypothetical protein HY051_06065 [Candidatus Aenigmarchaeota archaeon]|nr:hypothetical protein [Candidatus Aenigmarchaeota archaeon]